MCGRSESKIYELSPLSLHYHLVLSIYYLLVLLTTCLFIVCLTLEILITPPPHHSHDLGDVRIWCPNGEIIGAYATEIKVQNLKEHPLI